MKVRVVNYFIISEESLAAGVPVPLMEHDVGDVLELDSEQAQYLIDRRYAVPDDGGEG
jgi:hypothetical protein